VHITVTTWNQIAPISNGAKFSFTLLGARVAQQCFVMQGIDSVLAQQAL
jgi:hypothetical protein